MGRTQTESTLYDLSEHDRIWDGVTLALAFAASVAVVLTLVLVFFPSLAI
jgi:hypothetical protein